MAQITISKEWLKEVCQDVIDNALNEIKDEFISKSVIEDIRAEIEHKTRMTGDPSEYHGLQIALEVIDKHISGKENN